MLERYKRHYKNILILGIPIVVGQLGIIFVSLADNIMIGQYRAEHLAAASFVNSVFNIPILFGLGFSYGLTPLVGQMYGDKNHHQIGQYLKNSLVVNLLIGILLTVLMCVVYQFVGNFGQPEELLPLIRPYFQLQLLSLIFVMLFNSFKQFSEGVNNTRTPMYIMLIANVFNIVGNYVLIYGKFGFPEMGLFGAGLSTLIARALMLLMFVVVFCRRGEFAIYYVAFKRSILNKIDIVVLNKMGWMVGAQMGLETALFSIACIMVGWLGAMTLAAHQVLVAVSTLGFMLYYGIGSAMSVRISNHYGRGDIDMVKSTTIAGLHIMLLLALIVSIVFFAMRNVLGLMFTSEEGVTVIVTSLVMYLIMYQLGDALQIVYANALRAIGDVVPLAVFSFVGYILVALPMCYFFGFILDWGIYGIWLGFPVGLTVAGVLFCFRFYWKVKRL